MNFTKNWGMCQEKRSPGSADATDRGQPKKEHIQYSRKKARSQGSVAIEILGKTVSWIDETGKNRSGTVTGEYCPSIQLGLHFYKIRRRSGKTEWIPGNILKICGR